MNPLVSVVMPAYNAADHIAQSITTVLSQTYSEIELLIVDDGSTDNTVDVINSFDDNRMTYIRTINKGNYHARNRGLTEVSGRFVAFIDADDVWDSDKLKVQLDAFKASPDIGMCCTDHYVFHDDDLKRRFIDPLHGYRNEYLDYEVFLNEQLLENQVITSSVMLDRKCINRLGMFDTAYQNAMDYEYWLRMMFNYRSRYLKGRYIFKRIHPGNISRNMITSLRAVLYICRKMDTFMRKTPFYRPEHRELLRRKMQRTMYMLGMEYLTVREYDLAVYYLSKCHYDENKLYLHIALAAARLRIDQVVSIMDAYRKQRRRQTLVQAV